MRKQIKFLQLAIPVLVMIMALITPKVVLSQTDPPTAHLFVNPASSTASTCAAHQIAIRVEEVENLTAFELLVTFDPAVVEITDVQNGGFLVAPDESALYSPDNNDGEWNVDGFISFGMAQQRNAETGELNPKSGSGDLILITMQALIPYGTSEFEIDEIESMLVWWGEVPGEDDGPVDGSLIPYTKTDGVVNTSNCLPIADDQTVMTDLDTPVAITLTGSDSDDDPLIFYLVDLPKNGNLSGTAPSVTYTPDSGYSGSDSFTFVVNDGYDVSSPGTVTIIVEEEKEGPLDILLSNDTILEGEPVGTCIGVFSTVTNDITADYDYELVSGEGDNGNGSFEIYYNDITGEYELRSSEVFDFDVQETYSIRVRSTDKDDPELNVEKIFNIKILQTVFGYYFPIFTH